jgi:hypothetical protein
MLLGVGLAQAQGDGSTRGQQPAQASVRNGAQWWTSLSDGSKNTFLDGYVAAMSRVSNRLFDECAEKMKKVSTKITSDGRSVPTVLAPDANVEQIWDFCVLGGSFDFAFDRRDLRKGVDEFYKETQNSQVPIGDALQHVRDVLQSKKPKGQGIGKATHPLPRSATAALNC